MHAIHLHDHLEDTEGMDIMEGYLQHELYQQQGPNRNFMIKPGGMNMKSGIRVQ
jgi:hypothetical protein